MHYYPKEVSKAATWILKNKERSANWNWWAISERNPDDTGVKFTDVVAFQVINIMVAKGLLVPMTLPNGQDSLGQYSLDLSDTKKWDEVQKPPGLISKLVIQPFVYIVKNVWLFVFWISSLVISGALTRYIGILVDNAAR